MRAWVKALTQEQVAETSMRYVEIGGRRLLVGLASGRAFACEDRCPHAGAPLSQGDLKGSEIQCGRHGWVFDVLTGHSVPGPTAFRLKQLRTEVRDGAIWIEV